MWWEWEFDTSFPEEKINIRLDYGIGRKSSGDYIDINEAF
jgi:hypothetical protein